jgi:hypothetical protein
MPDTIDPKDPSQSLAQSQSRQPGQHRRQERVQFLNGANTAGFLLLFTGIVLLVGLGLYLYGVVVRTPLFSEIKDAQAQVQAQGKPNFDLDEILAFLAIERWVPAVFIFLLSALCLFFARASFQSSGVLTSGIVPGRDRELVDQAIKNGNSEPIDQYIRLASLNGTIGMFTKVGLTGLPLATILLVVFFSLIAFYEAGTEKYFVSFMDLTKLTLGAFIGSYVQRAVERGNQQAELQKAVREAVRSAGTASTTTS